jgi:DDE superfamily endonuclease
MDGHSSHVNIEFVKFCWSKKIIPICLPPHSTHLLQPLDLVIFSVLKRLYSSKVNKYAARGITGINRDYFLRILGEIRPQVYTRELIRSAFEAAGLLPFNPNRALARCSKQPTSIEPSTPPPHHAEVTILSSPMHPPLPDSEYARARYTHTILHPETTPEATEAVISKLMQHLQSLEEGLELMQVKNNNLRQCTKERKAKKKRKRNVLSTESVLTLEAMRELATTKEATQKAKEQATLTRKQLKKDR